MRMLTSWRCVSTRTSSRSQLHSGPAWTHLTALALARLDPPMSVWGVSCMDSFGRVLARGFAGAPVNISSGRTAAAAGVRKVRSLARGRAGTIDRAAAGLCSWGTTSARGSCLHGQLGHHLEGNSHGRGHFRPPASGLRFGGARPRLEAENSTRIYWKQAWQKTRCPIAFKIGPWDNDHSLRRQWVCHPGPLYFIAKTSSLRGDFLTLGLLGSREVDVSTVAPCACEP